MSYALNGKLIEHYYVLGGEAKKRSRKHPEHGDQVMTQLAREVDECFATVYNAKNFAELYSRRDLKSLLRQRIRHAADNFGWSHVIELVKIKDREVRLKLQRAALKGRWTVKKLKKRVREELELLR